MSTTSPSNIFYPDATGQYNLVADLATMAQSIQNALNKQANAHYGTDSQRIAYTSKATNGTLWSNSDGDMKTYQFRNGRWYPDYEFVPLDVASKTNGNFEPDQDHPLGVHVTGYGRMGLLAGRMVQKSIFDWNKNTHWTMGYIPKRVAPATPLNNLSSVWSPQDTKLIALNVAIRGYESTPSEAGRVRVVPEERWRNTQSSTGASLEVPGLSWVIPTRNA